jgi:predicted metal-dependent hydrolase
MSYGTKDTPLIIAFVGDLFFNSRIVTTAQNLGYSVTTVEREDDIWPYYNELAGRPIEKHLEGQGTPLLDQLSMWHPTLVIFDLSNPFIPWREWIIRMKTSPATRRIPVLCFGAHRDTDRIKSAKAAGADAVVTNAQFVESLGDLIQKYARRIDRHALEDACRLQLSEIALRGIAEFNRGEFFEAHESLEEAWNQDETIGRELYRAILQVAVAYLQIERGNFRGAIKMFQRSRQWIDPLPETCRGVNIAQLRSDARLVLESLISLGADRISEFDRTLFKPVQYTC